MKRKGPRPAPVLADPYDGYTRETDNHPETKPTPDHSRADNPLDFESEETVAPAANRIAIDDKRIDDASGMQMKTLNGLLPSAELDFRGVRSWHFRIADPRSRHCADWFCILE